MDDKFLVHTLPRMLEAKKPNKPLMDVKAEEVADTLGERKQQIFGYTKAKWGPKDFQRHQEKHKHSHKPRDLVTELAR